MENARGALQSIVPAHLAAAIDWSTLTVQPGSFVDEILQYRHTDLLFSARLRNGTLVHLYVLFEHQSSPPTENLMGHRLYRYKGRIWDHFRKEHPGAKRLPLIFPIVLYHGTVPWPEPRAFAELIDIPAELWPAVARYEVQFEYLLHDLSKISEDELRAGGALTPHGKLVFVCFKHAWADVAVLPVLERWLDVMAEVRRGPNGWEALQQIMYYVLHVTEHVEPEALLSLLARALGPEAKDIIMSAAQRLREQGIQEGIQQGSQQMLLSILQQRFGGVDARVKQRVTTASAEQLDAWSRRLFSAATVDEVLAD